MSECTGCTKGVLMCQQSPCHGTAEDFSRLIEHGLLPNISLQIGICIDEGQVTSALIPSYEGMNGHIHYNRLPHGRCSLLEEDRCQIHTIKPLLGKVSCCKDVGHDGELYQDTRHIIKESWKGEPGKALIMRWGEFWKCPDIVTAILDFPKDSDSKKELQQAIDTYNKTHIHS